MHGCDVDNASLLAAQHILSCESGQQKARIQIDVNDTSEEVNICFFSRMYRVSDSSVIHEHVNLTVVRDAFCYQVSTLIVITHITLNCKRVR